MIRSVSHKVDLRPHSPTRKTLAMTSRALRQTQKRSSMCCVTEIGTEYTHQRLTEGNGQRAKWPSELQILSLCFRSCWTKSEKTCREVNDLSSPAKLLKWALYSTTTEQTSCCLPGSFIHCYFRQILTMHPRLAPNSWFSCLNLLRDGLIGLSPMSSIIFWNLWNIHQDQPKSTTKQVSINFNESQCIPKARILENV